MNSRMSCLELQLSSVGVGATIWGEPELDPARLLHLLSLGVQPDDLGIHICLESNVEHNGWIARVGSLLENLWLSRESRRSLGHFELHGECCSQFSGFVLGRADELAGVFLFLWFLN